MNDKVQTTPAAIEPEGATKFRPFTEDVDAEGHVIKYRPFTEDAPEAEGGIASRHLTDDADTEGHMPFRKAQEPGPDEPGAADTEAHVIQATEDAGIAPEGAARYHPFTEGDDDATGIEPDGSVKYRP
jgi:hypothetical protein